MSDGKRNYYVSVQSSSIVKHRGDMSYEFEILATEDEAQELQRLLDSKDQAENGTYLRSHVPFLPYHNDASNDKYDEAIMTVYRKLHELGTSETRMFIANMGILREGFALQDTGVELEPDQL